MLRLSRLNFLFQEIVRETDGVDTNDYKPHILKVRLRKSYPALKFHKSSETYLVYVDLSAEEIVHEAAASSSSSSSPSEDSRGEMTTTGRLESESATMNDSRLLYHAALTLNGIIQETAKKTPTLPARDLTLENALRVVPPQHTPALGIVPPQHTPALGIVPPQHTPALRVVPPQLFNFIAWASGISSLPSDERVEVSVEDSRKIVSSCQDIIALATSGR